VMAYRTDSAKPLDQYRNLPVRPSDYKPFKPPEFDNMQPGLFDFIVFIQKYSNLAVAFHARHRLEYDFSGLRIY
jgi:hypothetical protein